MPGISTTVPAGPIVGPIIAFGVVTGVALLWRRQALSAPRATTVLVTSVYVGAVLSLTLFPLQIQTGVHANRVPWIEKANLVPVLTIDPHTFVLNILLLLPLGVLLPLLRRETTWGSAVGVGLLTSAAVESTQWITDIFLSSGRIADVNDLIANSLGAVAGYALMRSASATRAGAGAVARFALRTSSASTRREQCGVGA